MKKKIIIPIVALIVVLGGVFALWKTGVIKKKQITTDVNQKINEKLLLDVLALDRGEWKEELST